MDIQEPRHIVKLRKLLEAGPDIPETSFDQRLAIHQILETYETRHAIYGIQDQIEQLHDMLRD